MVMASCLSDPVMGPCIVYHVLTVRTCLIESLSNYSAFEKKKFFSRSLQEAFRCDFHADRVPLGNGKDFSGADVGAIHFLVCLKQ